MARQARQAQQELLARMVQRERLVMLGLPELGELQAQLVLARLAQLA
jgi:hypothetical protein